MERIALWCFKFCKWIGWFEGSTYFFILKTKLWEKKWRRHYPNSELLESLSKISRLTADLGKLM